MPRQRACNASEFREKERMPMAEKTDERVTDEKVVEIESSNDKVSSGLTK